MGTIKGDAMKHELINVHSYVDEDFAAYMLYIPRIGQGAHDVPDMTRGNRAVINGKAVNCIRSFQRMGMIAWTMYDCVMYKSRKGTTAWI
jgi:hypothetical protein